MKKIFKEEKGFTLIITILSLVVISILGLTIIGVTTSNFKMVKIDSKSQSAYYIAEAGINYMIDDINIELGKSYEQFKTREEISQYMHNELSNRKLTLNKFEEHNGYQPKANVTVEAIEDKNSDNEIGKYKITSEGIIGESNRSISSIISIGWDRAEKEEDNMITDNLLFYAKNFSFHGASVNAVSGSIIMDGLDTHQLNGGSILNISNMYFNGPVNIDGGSATFGSKSKPGDIWVNGSLNFWSGKRDVYGDIRVKGKFSLKDARVHGDVYVHGDLELGWTPEIDKKIYYTGELTAPPNYNSSLLNKCIKVNSVESFKVPSVEFSLRPDTWYINNGYKVSGNETGILQKDTKIFVDNYKNNDWQEIKGENIIVSKGDIVLRGGNGFTGALIAPNGSVEYSGDGVFNGIIISKNQISLPKGGNTINFKTLNEIFPKDVPLIIKSLDNDENKSEDMFTDKGEKPISKVLSTKEN